MHLETILKVYSFALLSILSSIGYVTGATNLSGEIGGLTLKSSGNPYIVNEELVVSSQKTTVIDSGCVFLFKPFTGITINGSIKIAGTPGFPVILSSLNDQEYNITDNLPESFDWNGITISSKAQDVIIENIALKYSVFGIKSEKNELTIKNAIFSQNGQYNFTVNGTIQNVKEGILYSYLKGNTLLSQTDSPQTQSKDTITPSEKQLRHKKLVTPIVASAITLGSGGCSAYFFIDAHKTHKKYSEADTNFNAYLNKEFKTTIKGAVCSGIAATSLVVAIISYVRKPADKKKRVSFYYNNFHGAVVSGIEYNF